VIDHPVVIAVNPTMGYIPKPRVIAEIIRRHSRSSARGSAASRRSI